MKLWTGQTVSELGSVVTRTALPIAAVLTLHATAFQLGILVASASTAVLLVGLLAGALVDRSRRRPLMIASDSIRAALLLSIPATAIAGTLRIEQLYVVAFIEAALGSIFDIAYRTYLPSLLPAERLMEGNTKIGMTGAIAEIGRLSVHPAAVRRRPAHGVGDQRDHAPAARDAGAAVWSGERDAPRAPRGRRPGRRPRGRGDRRGAGHPYGLLDLGAWLARRGGVPRRLAAGTLRVVEPAAV